MATLWTNKRKYTRKTNWGDTNYFTIIPLANHFWISFFVASIKSCMLTEGSLAMAVSLCACSMWRLTATRVAADTRPDSSAPDRPGGKRATTFTGVYVNYAIWRKLSLKVKNVKTQSLKTKLEAKDYLFFCLTIFGSLFFFL